MRTTTPAAAPAIEVAGLCKSFGDTDVLTGIDHVVPSGTAYALLGPNGAGKTTAVRILTTLIAGQIPARRLGSRWVVPRKAFHAWLDATPSPHDLATLPNAQNWR